MKKKYFLLTMLVTCDIWKPTSMCSSKISKQNRIKYFSTWMGAITAASAAEAAASELALKEKVNLG